VPNRSSSLLHAFVLSTAAAILVGCSGSSCELVWSSSAVVSPDHHWSAQVRHYVCSTGLSSWQEKDVELSSLANRKERVTLLTPTGQWTDPAQIQLHWVGLRDLRIDVPNRTGFDSAASHYKDVRISVEYLNNDPGDRAGWMEWMKRNDEHLRNGEELEPPPPTEPLGIR
jgi:hypothetical protein